MRFCMPLLAYTNAKTWRINKTQIKQDGYRNKNGQSGENNCNGEDTFKLRCLDKKN